MAYCIVEFFYILDANIRWYIVSNLYSGKGSRKIPLLKEAIVMQQIKDDESRKIAKKKFDKLYHHKFTLQPQKRRNKFILKATKEFVAEFLGYINKL